MCKTSFLLTLAAAATAPNQPVARLDLHRYSGKWYVIGFLPTMYDRRWDYTTESYTPDPNGEQFAIYTTYRKNKKQRSVRSKAFIDTASGNAKWKVQFVWPFRADYWVIDLDADYGWTVVGHPKRHFLYIMCRRPHMPDSLYNQLLARCKEKGYDTSKMRRQKQETSAEPSYYGE